MADGYKVGDLDVAISGISKDAVSSIENVIKQLDELQRKVGVVSTSFNGAFASKTDLNIERVVSQANEFSKGLGDLPQATPPPTEEYEEFYATVADSEEVLDNVIEKQEELAKATENLTNEAEKLNAVNKGNKSLSELDIAKEKVAKLSKQLSEMAYFAPNPLKAVQKRDIYNTQEAKELRDYQKAINEATEAVKRAGMTEKELVLYDNQRANAIRKQNIEYYKLMLATGQAGEKAAEYRGELKRLVKEQEEADKVAGIMYKGSFGKLFARVGRIAFYRLIRRGLQIITQTFTGAIQEFAKVDDGINKTMSQLTSSTKVIQLSLGTMIFPVIQAITPAVQSLAVGFADMANAINKSMALAQGNATYTKINTEALKDYRKEIDKTSGALFDFDKFRALSNEQDIASTFLSTEAVTALDDAENKYNSIYKIANDLGSAFKDLFNILYKAGSPAILAILNLAQPIVTTISSTVGGVTTLINKLNELGALEPLIIGITYGLIGFGAVKVISSITRLASSFSKLQMSLIVVGTVAMLAFAIFESWGDMNTAQKILSVIGAITVAVLGLAIAFGAFHSAWSLGFAVAGIAAGIAAVVGSINAAKANIPQYAVGASDIDSGSLFIAGEAGKTEMVYSGDNGKTNVANVQQMAQAVYKGVYQATTDWWKSAKNDVGGDVYLDGEKIYQSTTSHAKKHGNKWQQV